MKLLSGNGRVLEIRDVGPVVMRVTARAGGPPIKFHGQEVLEDNAARATIRGLLELDLYDHETAR